MIRSRFSYCNISLLCIVGELVDNQLEETSGTAETGSGRELDSAWF